jgi:hypothetical protein
VDIIAVSAQARQIFVNHQRLLDGRRAVLLVLAALPRL